MDLVGMNRLKNKLAGVPADKGKFFGGRDGDERISQLIEDVIRRRSSGEEVGDQQIVDAHRHLLPDLAQKLSALHRVELAERQSRQSDTGTMDRAQGDHGSGPRWLSEGLPGYEVLHEEHRGGQGVVYRATQERTHRDVAIKLIREGPFHGPADRARFEREVRILGRLRHPNIVTIHDSGTVAGCHYFVMDYIEGHPLDTYLSSRSLSVKQILRLFWKICDAVNAAHLHGITHRDLKPSNIRIDKQGEPHILDFGLAKVASEEMGDASQWRNVTMTGQFVGSVPWASPEQADGPTDRIDLRTDVYSLGVLLFSDADRTVPLSHRRPHA